MRIKVCLPFYNEFESAKKGLVELRDSTEHEFIIPISQGTYIWEQRNRLISGNPPFPDQGFDAFLDVDSDIEFTLKDVLSMISRNVEITTLPYLIHRSDLEYQCGWFKGVPGAIGGRFTKDCTGYARVPWSGNGMRLTMAECFLKMRYPWYYHPMINVGNYEKEAGEDIGFSLRAKDAGIDIWCDFDRPVKHRSRDASQFDWNY